MEELEHNSKHRVISSHSLQIIVVLACLILGYSIFGLLSIAISAAFGWPIEQAEIMKSGSNNQLMVMQVLVTFGAFILPALILPKLFFGVKTINYLGLMRNNSLLIYVLAFLTLLSIDPIVNFTYFINKSIHFPIWLAGLEANFLELEKQQTETMQYFIAGTSYLALIKNLLIVAFWAALTEEVFFRGLLIPLLRNWTGRVHLSVWLGAFFFSAIHLQFFGFIPRFILGLLFGYLFIWTGNLKVSLLLHTINNGVQVYMVWLASRAGTSLPIDQVTMPKALALGAGILLTSCLMWLIYRITHRVPMPNRLSALFSNPLGRINGGPWAKVYADTSAIQAEIIAARLRNEGIDATVINKKSSVYNNFGLIEVMVKKEDYDLAISVLNEEDTSSNPSEY
ncbi:MAG: CPBP family glutamic-type intramembrane protease [Bacteroidota bacterium]|nr:CPBP family glutamic-type intramembrane protease [Bacteroidota bacterium]